MKRVILAAVAALCVFVTSATVQKYRHGESVLVQGVSVHCIPPDMKYIPFVDNASMKVGFLRNMSDLPVSVRPIYDEVYSNGYLLVAVKSGNKWGCIDIGGRYVGYEACEPIIPLNYSRIIIKGNDVAICDGVAIDISKYEKWK